MILCTVILFIKEENIGKVKFCMVKFVEFSFNVVNLIYIFVVIEGRENLGKNVIRKLKEVVVLEMKVFFMFKVVEVREGKVFIYLFILVV